MVAIEPKSSPPRSQRLWIRCPAPGISHPTAGAKTAMVVSGAALFSVVSDDFLPLEEFAIQISTISRWILPVTSASFGRTSTFTSLRTPNSGR
ncbi:hypothetical protein SBA7_820019 [Candidatus Sulfotelmatobacter sp. SbA7]|nr:hypothetical protein SBA7_820019 [Candidatus Sulfotelmatobacter sp. SbA7]